MNGFQVRRGADLMKDVPLFPLNALVCPGGRLPLRVFEARYLDMLSHCLKQETGFVVVMLREGDAFTASPFYSQGTLTKIIDFGQSDDGIVNIMVEGLKRVEILSAHQQQDGLWLGEIEYADEEYFVPLPEQYKDLKDVLEALVQHPSIESLAMQIDYDDGRQIGWRLTELLPLENAKKQKLFELLDPISRLEEISDQLNRMVS